MRDIFYRFIAMMLLAVPGILAAYGFLQIKDALFLYFSEFGDASAEPALNWGKLILGLVCRWSALIRIKTRRIGLIFPCILKLKGK